MSFDQFDLAFEHVKEEWRRNTIEFAFLTGWRSGRVRGLLWSQISDNTIYPLPDQDTKKAPAPLPLSGRLLQIIEAQAKLRRDDCPFVFHHASRKIGNFRKAWYQACKTVGLSKILPHDFRRSMARNLNEKGIPATAIMARAGWRTASTLNRYHISTPKDQLTVNSVIDQARSFDTQSSRLADQVFIDPGAARSGVIGRDFGRLIPWWRLVFGRPDSYRPDGCNFTLRLEFSGEFSSIASVNVLARRGVVGLNALLAEILSW